MKDYKKEYKELKGKFDRFVKHKNSHNKQCKQCKEFYDEVIQLTKTIKNKNVSISLIRLWKVLWLNGESNFDIILYETNWEKLNDN